MLKRNIEPAAGETVRLRLLTEADLPTTRAWRNQDNIRRWFIHSDKISEIEHLEWFKNYSIRDDDFIFVIEEITNGLRPIGQVSIYRIDWDTQRAEFGRLMIGEPDAAGKGYAYEASCLAADIAFITLGLREIYLEVFIENVKAISIYKKMGFKSGGECGGKLCMSLQANQSIRD